MEKGKTLKKNGILGNQTKICMSKKLFLKIKSDY